MARCGNVRIAMGGVAPRPWRLSQVEAALQGRPATPESFQEAASLAGEGAVTTKDNAFKVKLMERAILRGLQLASA